MQVEAPRLLVDVGGGEGPAAAAETVPATAAAGVADVGLMPAPVLAAWSTASVRVTALLPIRTMSLPLRSNSTSFLPEQVYTPGDCRSRGGLPAARLRQNCCTA